MLEAEPLVITAAEGMYLIDSDGNRYLDGVSSLWCNVHGHRVREIDDAIRAQLDKVAHTTMLGLANEPATLLAERLMKIVPQNLKKVFYSMQARPRPKSPSSLPCSTGTTWDSPRSASSWRWARHTTATRLARCRSDAPRRFIAPICPWLFKVHFAPTRADQLETILKQHADRIAAIALEPIVQGAAGIIVHPPGFLSDARKLATKYEVLLICDEVATGFGRTGRMFAVEHEHVQPDLMCVGKGITGGYLPLAATLATQEIFRCIPGRTLRSQNVLPRPHLHRKPAGMRRGTRKPGAFREEQAFGSCHQGQRRARPYA
jgi:adenosylmethionine-8-amino-7-oxononanoate aminotransferase